jgi:signal transduction histidine kinase
LRNKVNIFKRLFSIIKNHFKIFVLILLILCSCSLKSQDLITYDSLLSRIYSTGIPDDTIKVLLLYDLAVESSKAGIEGDVVKGSNIKEASYYCYEAMKLSLFLNYNHGQELFFKTFSTIYNQKTDLPVLGYMDFDDNISNTNFKDLHYYMNKKHFGSLDNYVRAIQKLQEMNAGLQVSMLEYWIGLVYFDWFNYKRAIYNFKIAINSDGIKSDSITSGDIYQFMGASYFYMGCYDSSIVYFNKSLSFFNKKNELFKNGIYLMNLGRVYYQKSDFSTALQLYNQSLMYFSPATDSAYIAYAMNELGAVYTATAEFGLAKEALFTSLNISTRLKDKLLPAKTYMNLSGLFAATGEYKKAYLYQIKLHQVKDSLLINEVATYYKSYEENWQNAIGREITKKESESLKRGETTVALNKSRLSQLVLGLVILFILVIASYTYRLYQLKQKANIYLSELNKSREKLLSVISHDVRGPITGFINLLEPLNQQINYLSPKQVSGHLRQIIDLSQSIKLLVDNLLEWTKAQQGLIVCTPEAFLLTDIINQNIDIYRQIAKSKGIIVSINIQPEVKIFADRNMIQVVFRNLLNNAVKFTKTGGSIVIDTRREENKVIVSVTDTGIGMSKEMKTTIFNKDIKLNDFNAGRKNSGLGLVLCREYVEKCGGEIWVESDGIDTGSTFSFTVKSA